jgi:hypothetical protein
MPITSEMKFNKISISSEERIYAPVRDAAARSH